MNKIFTKCFILFIILSYAEGRSWKLTIEKYNSCRAICQNENTKYEGSLQNCYTYEDFNITVTECIAMCLHNKKGHSIRTAVKCLCLDLKCINNDIDINESHQKEFISIEKDLRTSNEINNDDDIGFKYLLSEKKYLEISVYVFTKSIRKTMPLNDDKLAGYKKILKLLHPPPITNFSPTTPILYKPLKTYTTSPRTSTVSATAFNMPPCPCSSTTPTPWTTPSPTTPTPAPSSRPTTISSTTFTPPPCPCSSTTPTPWTTPSLTIPTAAPSSRPTTISTTTFTPPPCPCSSTTFTPSTTRSSTTPTPWTTPSLTIPTPAPSSRPTTISTTTFTPPPCPCSSTTFTPPTTRSSTTSTPWTTPSPTTPTQAPSSRPTTISTTTFTPPPCPCSSTTFTPPTILHLQLP